jgi:hypothetical protein
MWLVCGAPRGDGRREVPTSVLLAVLAAAGLLALAPALTRRYDATERVAAERAASTARVLARRRRRRTVPGSRPLNPGRHAGRVWTVALADGSPVHPPRDLPRSKIAPPGSKIATTSPKLSRRAAPKATTSAALYRRRRVFLALILLNLVELAGVFLVGPGFWIGFSVSFVVLLADVVYLRRHAVRAADRRQRLARRAAWVASEQAAVRREHDRRAAERRAQARRVSADREAARRRADDPYVERYDRRTAPGS